MTLRRSQTGWKNTRFADWGAHRYVAGAINFEDRHISIGILALPDLFRMPYSGKSLPV
jgi:hypothetical protein